MKYLMLLLPVVIVAADTDYCEGVAAPSPRWHPAPSDRQHSITWTQGPDMPGASCRGASGLINGKIYVFGGQPTPSAVHHVYDIASGTWDSNLTPDPYAGSNSWGVVYNDELYVLGAFSPDHATYRKYDPATDTWTTLSSPPGVTVAYKNGCGVVGDKIYYYCGRFNANHYTTQVWEYDPASDSWTQKNDFPGAGRAYHASCSDGTYCYAIAGYTGSVIQDCWKYDPSSDTWTQIEDYPLPLIFGNTDVLAGAIFSAGGGGGYNPWPALADVYYWEDGAGWTATDFLPVQVGIPHTEVYYDGSDYYIFVFGGYNGTYLSTLYIGAVTLGIEEAESKSPVSTRLSVNPSLIKDHATIEFQLSSPSHVTIRLLDITGREVSTVTDRDYAAGVQRISISTREIPAGVYFVNMTAGSSRLSERITVIR
ncbi:MAG TPA: T9SS type A sorting domain-containing protein [bacterium (Candidatus Stahlbacteria)]|nr:T9SS type A sorting domain-containing protein [Candidatus Stahlbacteria bacterium]